MALPLRIVVMGVSGCGKTHVGRLLADQQDACFLDADDFHSEGNREKMASGQPLTDQDRMPWLAQLGQELASRERVVLACSALRKSYRDRLRSVEGLRFVFLDGAFDLIFGRMQSRSDHFMPPSLLRSQFDTLERPGVDELDVVRVSIEHAVEDVVTQAIQGLEAGGC